MLTSEQEERRNPAPARPWERHLQTILTALVLAAIMWNYETLDELRLQQVKTASSVELLKSRIEYQMQDRFTGSQAQVMISEIKRLSAIAEAHENRLDAVEVAIAKKGR